MLVSELVCQGCRRILCYPYGAASCRCRRCASVTPAQYAVYHCQGCNGTPIAVSINTLTAVCPICATITDIPESFLPISTEDNPFGCGGGYIPVLPSAEEERRNRNQNIFVTYEVERKSKKKRKQKSLPKSEENVGDDGNNSYASSASMSKKDGKSYCQPVMLVGRKII